MQQVNPALVQQISDDVKNFRFEMNSLIRAVNIYFYFIGLDKKYFKIFILIQESTKMSRCTKLFVYCLFHNCDCDTEYFILYLLYLQVS